MLRRILRLLVSSAAVVGLSVTCASVAEASGVESESEDGRTITWMVRPSDGVGEDARSWVELQLEPGQTAHDFMLVRNLSRETVTFTLSAADGYFTDTGRFNMLTADQESTDAGTWITIRDSVTVPSGQDMIVPFSVRVPHDATPGDHAAGVAASVRSGGDEFGIDSRIGFRVMTRVSGDLVPSAAVEVSGDYRGTWNPFDTGQIRLDYTVYNIGNTRLSVIPQVAATSLFGLVSFTVPGDEIVEFAPGEFRTGRVSIPAAWPLFVYTAEVTATSTSIGEEHSSATVEPATATTSVLAVPWPQLVVIAIAALVLLWAWIGRRHRHRESAAVISGSNARDATKRRRT